MGNPEQEQVYTLTSADRPYRVIVERMGEGAATVSARGVILFANPQLAHFLGIDRDSMIGRDITDYVGDAQQEALSDLLVTEASETRRSELTLAGHPGGAEVPVLVASTALDLDGVLVRCLVFTDLTMQKQIEQQVAEASAQAERQRVAREVNDTIVQGLVTAEMALDLERFSEARTGDRQHVPAGAALDRRARGRPPGPARDRCPQRPCGTGAAMTETVNVLVVDDSSDLRELISFVIKRHPDGWQVVATAAEGQQAVDAARTQQPDLVLLDIAMPVMDGMQALPLIREAAPDAVVVMLSGYPFDTAGQGALDAGAHGYLEKSNLVRSLIPNVERILAEARG